MTKPRKPTKGEMTQEIASIDKDITRALVYGGPGFAILENPDEVLRARGGAKGLKLYDEVEKDAQASAVLFKRKAAVTSREWFVDAASDSPEDQAIADEVEAMLKAFRFDKFTKALLGAQLKGFAVVEIMWARRDNRIVPARFVGREQTRFVFDSQSRLRMVTAENMITGIELPDRKFVVYSFDSSDGQPYGRALGRKLFWPAFFKRQGISFWLVFADKFGSPTAMGSYPAGTSPADQQKLLKSLRAIGQDAGIVVQDGMVVKLLEAARSGTADAYSGLTRYMDEQISLAVLGETLTTNAPAQGGSRAQGEVHNEIREELAKDDADDVCDTINETLIKWIVEYNWPGRVAPKVWRRFETPEDSGKAAERDKVLHEMGWQLTEDRVRETYGEGYERIPERLPAAPAAHATAAPAAGVTDLPTDTPEDAAQFSEPGFFQRLGRAVARVLGFAEAEPLAAAREQNREDQQALVDAADQLAREWQPLMGPRVDELKALFEESGDLQTFRRRMDELLPAEPPPELVQTLQRATFAARLQGRTPRG